MIKFEETWVEVEFHDGARFKAEATLAYNQMAIMWEEAEKEFPDDLGLQNEAVIQKFQAWASPGVGDKDRMVSHGEAIFLTSLVRDKYNQHKKKQESLLTSATTTKSTRKKSRQKASTSSPATSPDSSPKTSAEQERSLLS